MVVIYSIVKIHYGRRMEFRDKRISFFLFRAVLGNFLGSLEACLTTNRLLDSFEIDIEISRRQLRQ